MRIQVLGDCPAARALRGDLHLGGFHITDLCPRFTIILEEHAEGFILIDSIDCLIDNTIVKSLRESSSLDLRIQTTGGVRSDVEIRIVVPSGDGQTSLNVEAAILRALLRMAGQGVLEVDSPPPTPPPPPKPSFVKRLVTGLSKK